MKTKLKTTFGRMKTKLAQICGKQQMLCVCDKSVNAKAFVSRKNFSHQKNIATVHSHASQCDRFNLNSVCMEEKHVTTWILADPTETKSNGVDFEIDWKIGICIRIIFLLLVGSFELLYLSVAYTHTHTHAHTTSKCHYMRWWVRRTVQSPFRLLFRSHHSALYGKCKQQMEWKNQQVRRNIDQNRRNRVHVFTIHTHAHCRTVYKPPCAVSHTCSLAC